MMILFLDIDGTILDANQNIAREDFDAISLIKKTNRVILISARKPSATLSVARKLQIKKDIIICYNGALILLGDKVVSEHVISNEIVTKICKVADTFGASINFYCGDKWITTKMDEFVCKESEIIQESPSLVLDAPGDLTVHKVLIMCKNQKTLDITNLLYFIKGININISKPGYVEITNEQASKVQAFYQVINFSNIPIMKTMAIGDGYNDIEMVKNAAIGVAMENAVEEVKRVANFVTLSNNHGGVAFAIKRFIKMFS